MTKTIVFTSQL